MGLAFDSGLPMWQGAPQTAAFVPLFPISHGDFSPMVKAEWGTKRTCPKCGVRFYDLGKEDPVTCVACGVAWDPEPVLKSKQPLPYDAPKKEVEVEEKDDADLAAEEIEVEEEAEENPDDEVDLGGDDDIGVAITDDDDEV